MYQIDPAHALGMPSGYTDDQHTHNPFDGCTELGLIVLFLGSWIEVLTVPTACSLHACAHCVLCVNTPTVLIACSLCPPTVSTARVVP